MPFAFEADILDRPAPAGPRYHDFPLRDERTVCLAFLDCFTSQAGQVVLDRWWQLMMSLPYDDPLRQALYVVFPSTIDTMRLGEAYKGQPPALPEGEPPAPY